MQEVSKWPLRRPFYKRFPLSTMEGDTTSGSAMEGSGHEQDEETEPDLGEYIHRLNSSTQCKCTKILDYCPAKFDN